jgi:hypothetical protein
VVTSCPFAVRKRPARLPLLASLPTHSRSAGRATPISHRQGRSRDISFAMPAPLLLSQTRRWSGDPAAFDRHGASTTPPDGYIYTSPGLMRS